MWVDRSSHWQRLCSRLTKLIWIQIELNWIWWHKLFWLDWFTSFWERKSWTAYFHSSASREWVDSQAIHEDSLSSILLIEWIDATEWAIDSLAIQQSCRWFYWLSDVVLSFEVVDHQINKFLYTRFVVRRVAWMNNEIDIM